MSIIDAPAERWERMAPGVAYSASDHARGLQMFACAPYRATLSTKSCATRWAHAQEAKGEEKLRLEKCRGCPIGAAHAGRDIVRLTRWYDSEVCPRCLRGGLRMVKSRRLCISCYNRSRELASGRNCRGNAPIELQARAPQRFEAIVSVDGQVRRVRMEVTGLQEFMMKTLQTTKGDIAFAFAGPRIQRQSDLERPEDATGGNEAQGANSREDLGEPAPAAGMPDGAVKNHQADLRYAAESADLLNAADFMDRALDMQGKGLLTGRDIAEIEQCINAGQRPPTRLARAVESGRKPELW